jgi:hypothetical protein
MKYLTLIIVTLLLSILFIGSACNIFEGPPPVQVVVLNYENITIYSDLSNRLSKNPNDKVVIDQIKRYFVKDCIKPGQKINDRSSLAFSRMNYFNSNCGTSKIDIEAVGTLMEKSKFVNDKGEGATLKRALTEFTNIVNCSYRETDSVGLDILSLLFNEISSGNPIKFSKSAFDGKDSTIFQHRNHIFIFTDGYLEFSKKDGNLNLYFGRPEIDKVRALCIQKKQSPRVVLSSCPSLRLMPLKSENNSLVNLYVLETGDRGLREETGTLQHTGELSDNNILKTVWELWAIESGFRQFSWKTATKGDQIPTEYIKSMIDKALKSPALQEPSGFVIYEKTRAGCTPIILDKSQTQTVNKDEKSKNFMPSSEKGQDRITYKYIPKNIEITPLQKPINSQIYRTAILQEPGETDSYVKRLVKGTYIKVLAYAVDRDQVYFQVQSDNLIGFVNENDIFINDDLKELLKKKNL